MASGSLHHHAVLIIAAIFLLVLAGLPFPKTHAEELGNWSATTSYPKSLRAGACVSSQGYIYCVAGNGVINGYLPFYVNATYYAPLTGSGIGSWSRTTDYPLKVGSVSCVTQAGYIICIGGGNNCEMTCQFHSFNSTYFAPLSTSGIGPWTRTSSYPRALSNVMCVLSSGFVYCLGGASDSSNPPTGVNASYYATVASGEVGPWKSTTSPPIRGQFASSLPCAAENGYVYCMFGGPRYARLSASGIGAWNSNVSNYDTGQVCVASSGYVYCIGGYSRGASVGDVYFARDLNPGLTPFLKTMSLPMPPDFGGLYSCPVDSVRIYCVGGGGRVYFTNIVPVRTITIYILCCDSRKSPYFYPQNVTMIVGLNNTVRWYNSLPPTNVTATDGSFSTGTIMEGNLSTPIMFSTGGTYSYQLPAVITPQGPAPRTTGTVRVVQALVVTTTATLFFTTTATATTTTTVITTSIASGGASGSLPGIEAVVVASVAIAITSAAVVLVIGRRLGSQSKGRSSWVSNVKPSWTDSAASLRTRNYYRSPTR